jgi:NADH:ubiquinone oxidoreductase subunit F (NADH-binding)
MDDSGSIVRATLRLAHFCRHESCGKCTLPRGTLWLERILRIVTARGRMEDLEPSSRWPAGWSAACCARSPTPACCR